MVILAIMNSRYIKVAVASLIIVLGIITTVGCGQKGDLYLPAANNLSQQN
jgi:predicted small lipoprotein YifL